jgi:AcrR family transcriptional regulator
VQARAIAKREQLLQGAAAAFDEVGYAGTSLSMIERRSGVSRGAMYFNFTTKREIADAVIDEQHAASAMLAQTAADTGAGPLEQIVMMCHGLADQILTDPLVRGGIRLTMELAFLEGPVDPYAGWVGVMSALLSQGQDAGDVTDATQPDDAAWILVSSFTGTQLVSHVLERRVFLHQRVHSLLRVFFAGVMTSAGLQRLESILGARL